MLIAVSARVKKLYSLYHIIFIHLPLDLYRYGNSHNNTYYIKVCSVLF